MLTEYNCFVFRKGNHLRKKDLRKLFEENITHTSHPEYVKRGPRNSFAGAEKSLNAKVPAYDWNWLYEELPVFVDMFDKGVERVPLKMLNILSSEGFQAAMFSGIVKKNTNSAYFDLSPRAVEEYVEWKMEMGMGMRKYAKIKGEREKKMQVICKGHRPSYANNFAAGLDIRAHNEVILQPGEIKDVETNLKVAIPNGYFGMVVPRSGIAFKHQITLINDVGIIDSDYRGDIGLRLINESKEPYVVKEGDRVAQMVLVPYIQAELEFANELPETERGSGGFGSSGK